MKRCLLCLSPESGGGSNCVTSEVTQAMDPAGSLGRLELGPRSHACSEEARATWRGGGGRGLVCVAGRGVGGGGSEGGGPAWGQEDRGRSDSPARSQPTAGGHRRHTRGNEPRMIQLPALTRLRLVCGWLGSQTSPRGEPALCLLPQL